MIKKEENIIALPQLHTTTDHQFKKCTGHYKYHLHRQSWETKGTGHARENHSYVYNWAWGLLINPLFFFSNYFSLGRIQQQNFNIYFFLKKHQPNVTKQTKSNAWILCLQIKDKKLTKPTHFDRKCKRSLYLSERIKHKVSNRFCFLVNPAASLKLNTVIMPVISYCSASCLQPGN